MFVDLMDDRIRQLRSLDEAIKSENDPSVDSISAALEQPLEWIFGEDPRKSHGLIKNAAWKRHLNILLQQVVPDWVILFESHMSRRLALEATVLGYSQERPIQDRSLTCAMAQTSLLVLVDCIQAGGRDAPAPEAISIYIHLLKRLTSQTLFALYMQEPPIDIRYFCTVLCSIPARVANAFGFEQSDSKEDWYLDKNYFARMSRFICQETIKSAEDNKDKKLLETQIAFAGELIAKMVRQGYASDCVETIYPILVAQYHKKSNINDNLSQIWFSIWRRAERTSGIEKIAAAALQYVVGQCSGVNNENIAPSLKVKRAAVDLSEFLFSGCTNTSEKLRCVEQFLFLALWKSSKALSSSLSGLRIAITAALHAMGIERTDDDQYKLSVAAEDKIYDVAKRLCDTWTSSVFIAHYSYHEQEYTTAALLNCAAYLSKDRLQELIVVTPIFQGIHRWLESGDPSSMKLGITVAESMSSVVDDEEKRLNTGVLKPDTDKRYMELKKLIHTRDAFIEAAPTEDDDNDDSGVIVEEVETSEDEQDKPLDPDMIINVDELGSDSDSEESDLEPYPMEEESDPEDIAYGESATPRKKRLKEPVYLLDLLSYLKDKEDPVKLNLALNAAEKLIRRKAGIGFDVEETAIPLAASLIAFDTSFDIKDADEKRQNALTALIVAVPRTVTGYIIDQLYDRNTATGTKQMILSSIIFAVRELAGLEKKNEDTLQDVPSLEFERLSIEPIESSSSTKQIGKARVFSRQSEVEKKRREQIRSNKLSGLAGPVFFFPLLVGWWEGAQGRLKQWIAQDNMLADRFVMTLNTIMHCSTNLPEKRRVVKEYFEFALPLRYAKPSRSVIRALLLGFSVALDVCFKGQENILLEDYWRELIDLKSWLEEIMERFGEDDLKALAVNLLMRLADISRRSY